MFRSSFNHESCEYLGLEDTSTRVMQRPTQKLMDSASLRAIMMNDVIESDMHLKVVRFSDFVSQE
jgi:hypothetical protein